MIVGAVSHLVNIMPRELFWASFLFCLVPDEVRFDRQSPIIRLSPFSFLNSLQFVFEGGLVECLCLMNIFNESMECLLESEFIEDQFLFMILGRWLV